MAIKGVNYCSEHEIQKNIVNIMRLNGYFTVNTDVFFALRFLGNNQPKRLSFIGQMKALGANVGCPDLIFFKEGEVLFVEMKTESGKLSKDQKDVIAMLTKMRFNVQVWRGIEDCLNYLEWSRSNQPSGKSSNKTSDKTRSL